MSLFSQEHLHVHVHIDNNDALRTLEALKEIQNTLSIMSKTLSDWKQLAQDLRTSIGNIGEDITRLLTELQRDDLTAAEEEEAFQEFEELATKAKDLAAKVPEPATSPNPNPETPTA